MQAKRILKYLIYSVVFDKFYSEVLWKLFICFAFYSKLYINPCFYFSLQLTRLYPTENLIVNISLVIVGLLLLYNKVSCVAETEELFCNFEETCAFEDDWAATERWTYAVQRKTKWDNTLSIGMC